MATTKPQRIQLKRTKGWSLRRESAALNGLSAIKCTRPGPFGNPFKVGNEVKVNEFGRPRVGGKFIRSIRDAEYAIALYRMAIEDDELPQFLPDFQFSHLMVPDAWDSATLLKMLRGANLACFCKPENVCHCDVLLDLANNPELSR